MGSESKASQALKMASESKVITNPQPAVKKSQQTAAERGAAAIEAKDFSGAIQQYTLAIADNPQAVSYYLKRSVAYIRSSPPNPLLSLFDAETATVLAHRRGRRELIAEGQLRRAIALYTSERYADAQECLAWSRKFNDKEKSLMLWEVKTSDRLKSLPESDDRGEVRVKEMPEIDIDGVSKAAKEAAKDIGKGSSAPTGTGSSKETPMASPTPQGVQTPPSKIRHDWFQTSDSVTVSLMVKGVPKDKATVNISDTALEISFPLPTGSDYSFNIEPFFAPVDASASSYQIMSTKIELTLKKAQTGVKWKTLEGNEPLATPTTYQTAVDQPSSSETAPSYPSSSRHGPKDWDKLVSSMTVKKDQKSSSSEPTKPIASDDPILTLDENDDEEGGDDVNKFFKTLYKNADPDTKRAMMKSYQESSGTSLSTNWADVGSRRMETSPPDGMEAKKWG